MELYEISEFCLVMANGSCPLPHLECLQAQVTFCRHFLYPVGSVLEQGDKPCHPERRMGKQQMKDGGGGGVKRRDREGAALLSRKVTGCGKAHRVTLPLTVTDSMFGN